MRSDPDSSRATMAERRRVLRAEHRKTVQPCDGSGNAPYAIYGDKGECVTCGGVFVLRKDGTVRAHDERRDVDPGWRAKEAQRQIHRFYRIAAVRCQAVDELEFYSSVCVDTYAISL